MSQEIRKQIDEIYQEIENLLNPSSFVLKPEVAILNGEIKNYKNSVLTSLRTVNVYIATRRRSKCLIQSL